jgi:hypothetical protein
MKKIGIGVVVVLILFLTMPSLDTLADFIKNSGKEKKNRPTEEFFNDFKQRADISELADGKNYHAEFIDDVEITDKDGNPISTIKRGQEFKVIYSWSVPDDVEVKKGDYMELILPKEASIHNSTRFPVIDEETNEKMGDAVLDHKTNTVTMVFTDYPETHSVVKGKLIFDVRLEVEKSENDQTIELEFVISDGVEIIEIEVPGEKPDSGNGESPIVEKEHIIGKYGTQGQNEGQLDWHVFVNERLDDLKGAVLEDELGPHQELDPDSFSIWKGTAVRQNGTLVDIEYVPTKDLDIEYRKNGFTINFGDIGKTVYQVHYSAYVDPTIEIINEKEFYNKATLSAENTETVSDEAKKTYVTGSGSGSGDATKKYNIREIYLDADGKNLDRDNLTTLETTPKEPAIFKTDTRLIDGYELVSYSYKMGKVEKEVAATDGQTIRLEVDNDTEITYVYEKSNYGPHIYLRTKDNQLIIHYRNVDELMVYIDGVLYETYPVIAQETDENITVPVRVNSDRTKVRVQGKLNGKVQTTATLNKDK